MTPDFSWGESAGAISAGLQMVAGQNGDPHGLFRGAFMVGLSELTTQLLTPTP